MWNILIGDFKDNIGTKLINPIIERESDDKSSIRAVNEVSEILAYSAKENIDLYVLILNNIKGFPYRTFSGEIYFKDVLDLLMYLKNEYQKPIIALSGRPDDPIYSEQSALDSGVDYYFEFPCNVADFLDIIRKILKIKLINGIAMEKKLLSTLDFKAKSLDLMLYGLYQKNQISDQECPDLGNDLDAIMTMSAEVLEVIEQLKRVNEKLIDQ